ncbi:MAG: MAC/perforin domain-containing protein [Pseudomonadota bacterium]
MLKTRIALAISATAVTGVAIYAADSFIGKAPEGSDPIELAVSDPLVGETIVTECGISNGDSAAEQKQAVVNESVTRARVLVGRSIGGSEDTAELIAAGDCRFRLDGVWVEDLVLALDKSVTAEGFSGEDGRRGDPDLTHATFLTPDALLIDASDDGQVLNIRNATGDGDVLVATALNEKPMAQIFSERGSTKTYRNPSPEDDKAETQIRVDVDRAGRMRVRIGDTIYYRPQPTVSQAADLSEVNPFMIGFNLLNLQATRKGYDIATQDMWELADNPKAEIFAAAAPHQYAVMEQRTVPLGYKLVPETAQGTLITSTLIRTEQQFQNTLSWNVGGKAKTGFDPSKMDYANSVGASYARSETEGMRSGQASSIMHSMSRHKLYTIVLDQPFVRLSDDFVVAVEDARREGRYDLLIEKFGTHYPNAVTYGSAGLAIAEFNEETLSNWSAQNENIDVNATFAIKQVNFELGGGLGQSTEEGDSFMSQTSFKDWRAVGGNGSFTEDGHSTGSPAPILADLRPLHLLLNPLNFPDEPEVYTRVREELRIAIEEHLSANALEGNTGLRFMDRKFEVTPGKIYCTSSGSEKKVEIYGWIDFKFYDTARALRSRNANVADWRDKRKERFKLNCGDGASGAKNVSQYGESITVRASRQQLASTYFRYKANLKENDPGSRDDVMLNGEYFGQFQLPLTSLATCQTKTITRQFTHAKNRNTFYVTTNVRRLPIEGTCND